MAACRARAELSPGPGPGDQLLRHGGRRPDGIPTEEVHAALGATYRLRLIRWPEDVSCLLNASRPLEHTAAEREILVDEAPVGICRLDRDGRLLAANQAFLDIIGATTPCSPGRRQSRTRGGWSIPSWATPPRSTATNRAAGDRPRPTPSRPGSGGGGNRADRRAATNGHRRGHCVRGGRCSRRPLRDPVGLAVCTGSMGLGRRLTSFDARSDRTVDSFVAQLPRSRDGCSGELGGSRARQLWSAISRSSPSVSIVLATDTT